MRCWISFSTNYYDKIIIRNTIAEVIWVTIILHLLTVSSADVHRDDCSRKYVPKLAFIHSKFSQDEHALPPNLLIRGGSDTRSHYQTKNIFKNNLGRNLGVRVTSSNITTIQSSSLPPELNLTIHEDLLTEEECNILITLAKPYLIPSKVGRPPKIEPSLRLSESCKLPRLPIPQLWSVEQKLAKAAGVPIERGEDLQIGAYPIGHYYGMHCDERQGGRANGGGRLATSLAYLNTLDSSLVTGGCTVFSGKKFDLENGPDFPTSDIRVRKLNELCHNCNDEDGNNDDPAYHENDMGGVGVSPKVGRVITFRNLAPCSNGGGDAAGGRYRFISESTHGACPVMNITNPPAIEKEGSTKYVVQQWFGLEHEVNVARHQDLIAHLGLGVADSFRVSPLADLASPDGNPKAFFNHNKVKNTEGVNITDSPIIQSVPSLIPNIGAIRIKGHNISLDSPGQTISTHELGKNGLVAAIWVKINKMENEQRLFQVGGHNLCVARNGTIVWYVDGIDDNGDELSYYTTAIGVRLNPNQWYHCALVIHPPSKEEIEAELYLSIPGHPPRHPIKMKIKGDKNTLKNRISGYSGVRIGGCRDIDSCFPGLTDMTVTDFYAINADYRGKGHDFAFAISYYNPTAGF